uniref:Uncharacterized protein n=1 Tax=Plectus sambesii TaxID=2011161 RepID=A0A914X075_9BILA
MFHQSFNDNDDLLPTISSLSPKTAQQKKRPAYMEVIVSPVKQTDDPFRLSSSSSEEDATAGNTNIRSKTLKRKVNKKAPKLPMADCQQPSLSAVKASWISRKRPLNASPYSPTTSLAVSNAIQLPLQKRACDEIFDSLSKDCNGIEEHTSSSTEESESEGDAGLRRFIEDLFDCATSSSSSDEEVVSDDFNKCNLFNV